MTTNAPDEPVTDLCRALWAFHALRVAAESDLLATLRAGPRSTAALAAASHLDPATTAGILGVLVAWGFVAKAEDDLHRLTPAGESAAAKGRLLLADLAATASQTHAFVDNARRGLVHGGWQPADAEMIRAQGMLSEAMMTRMHPALTAAFPAVVELLRRPDARFLDVGLGAAGNSIALCRLYPALRVVGLEPLGAAVLEARDAVAAAGLEGRIEVRRARVEELGEEPRFHVAFLASGFFSDDVLRTALERVRRCLVPGGAVLLSAYADLREDRAAAVSRLRAVLWGGGTRSADVVRGMLASAGFTKVHAVPAQGDIAPMIAFA